MGLWKDEHIAPLKRITDFISAQGSVPGIQLAHAGRKASITQPWAGDRLIRPQEGGWEVVSSNDKPFSDAMATPVSLEIRWARVVFPSPGGP